MAKKKKKTTNKSFDTQSYQDSLMQQAKGTIGLGVVTSLGSYGFSRLGNAYPAVKPTADMTVAALNLTNVGNLASVGMNLMPGMTTKKKGKTGNKYIDRMI